MLGRRIAAVACLVGLVVAVALLLHLSNDSSAGESRGGKAAVQEQGREEAPAPASTPLERRLQKALEIGVQEAAGMGGAVEAAVMLDESTRPLVATAGGGSAEREMRMWSISKVATMVTLLRLLGWEKGAGETPTPEVLDALAGALTRSENCRQRRIVLELQLAAGGIPQARQALAETFSLAGAKATPGSQVAAPESLCVPFLEEQREIPEPLAPALLLGTSRWRITDAVRLAHALATGVYGDSISAWVLEMIEAPKQPSRESNPGELTAPLDWGAGTVFAESSPAYKAGWGGSLNGNFLAGQIAVVRLGSHDHLALAVMVHPDSQPVRDDPGITMAPEAVQAVLESVRSSIDLSGSPARKSSASATSSGTD
jgi:hypothetical protein